MAKVSVIIPLYKSDRFIAATLDSVLAQTHQDFEVICVDDCPAEPTLAVRDGYARNDKRIKYVAHERNMGAPAFGRNTGLKHVTGEFVTFLDHDDTFLPTKFEMLLKALEDEGVDFVCSNIFLLNNATGKIDGPAWGTVRGNAKANFARRLLKGNFVPPNSTLMRRSVFERAGTFDTNLRGADDFDMWYRIARMVPATVHAEPLATWRYLNASSISANDELMVKDEMAFYQKIVNGDGWSDAEKEVAREGVRRNRKFLGNRQLLKGDFKAAAASYGEAGSAKLAIAARLLPWPLRFAYQAKRSRAKQFQPLDLDFDL